MKTDIFFTALSSEQLNESMTKQFGSKVNLEQYSREQLEDMRNKIRTRVFQQEGSAGFNDLLTNEAYQKDKAMLQLLNTRIKEMLGEDIKKLRDKMVELSENKKGVRAPRVVKHSKGTKAAKDYDGDGKVESPKAEVWGSRANAAAKSGKPFGKVAQGTKTTKSKKDQSVEEEISRRGFLKGLAGLAGGVGVVGVGNQLGKTRNLDSENVTTVDGERYTLGSPSLGAKLDGKTSAGKYKLVKDDKGNMVYIWNDVRVAGGPTRFVKKFIPVDQVNEQGMAEGDNPIDHRWYRQQQERQAKAAKRQDRQQTQSGVAEGSGPKEKQKTPYRDINSPEYRAAADKQKQRMANDRAAEPGKKLLAKKGVAEEVDMGQYDAREINMRDDDDYQFWDRQSKLRKARNKAAKILGYEDMWDMPEELTAEWEDLVNKLMLLDKQGVAEVDNPIDHRWYRQQQERQAQAAKRQDRQQTQSGVAEGDYPFTNPDYDPLKAREYRSKMSQSRPDLYNAKPKKSDGVEKWAKHKKPALPEGYSTLDLWNMSPKEVIELLDAKKITYDDYHAYQDLVIAGGPDEDDDFDYTDHSMRKGERGMEEGFDTPTKKKEVTTGKFDKKEIKPGVTQYTRKSSTFTDGGDDSDVRAAKKKAKSASEGFDTPTKKKEVTTGKFDKKEIKPGVTQYTRKSSTFTDGGDDSDVRKAKAKRLKESFNRHVRIVNESLAYYIAEDEEGKAKAITAASDMVNDFTSWMQRVGQYQTKAIIELADAIRADFSAEQAEAFKQAVSPALSATLDTLTQQREAISNAVAVLAGEDVAPANQMGMEPDMGAAGPEEPDMTAAAPDELNAEPGADEFAASDAAAGGAETSGREVRESKFIRKLAESHSIMARLAK